MSTRRLLHDLRALGVRFAIVEDRLRLDAPAGVLSPEMLDRIAESKPRLLRLLTDEARLLDLPLSRFAVEGRAIEVQVPWWSESSWFVPDLGDAGALVEAGVGRGRIWTVDELRQVAGVEDLADLELQSIATIKATFGCTVLEAVALGPAPPPTCRACRETSCWTHADGRQICARCHPPADRLSPADHADDPGGGRPR